MTTDAPTPANPQDRLTRWLPWIVGIALALPSLLARYLPMSDLSLHEGVVGVLRHFNDESYFPRGLYVLNLGHPNQLFHVTGWLLSLVVPTDWAVKIVIATAQLLIFVTGARLADHLGRSRWSVILLAPLALGFTYYWGLVANLLGYVTFLLALPTIDKNAVHPTLRATLQTCGLMLLLYFAHESVFAMAAGVVGLFALCYPLRPKQTALRLAPAFFAAAVAFLQFVWGSRLFTGGQLRPPPRYFSFGTRFTALPNVLFGSHEIAAQLLLIGLALSCIAALLVTRIREPRNTVVAHVDDPPESSTPLHRARTFLRAHRFEAVVVVFFVAYFVAPFSFNGATLIHERFLGPGWAILAVCIAPRGAPHRLAKIFASVLPLGILLLAWPQFLDADRSNRDLDVLFGKIPRGGTVALCAADRLAVRTRVYSGASAVSRSLAVIGGRTGLALVTSPISPVQINPELRWDEFDRRMTIYTSRAIKPAHDLRMFEWIVGQSRQPETRRIMIEAFAPDADLVAAQGEWMLFHSKYPIVPIMSPEPPLPPGLDSILDRLVFLARRDYNAAHPEDPLPEAPAP